MSPLWLFRISICGLILALWARTSEATEAYSHGEPSDLEQLLLERINETRANPAPTAARLSVRLGDASARQPLVFHSALDSASEAHSGYLITKNKFSHIGAGNTNAQQRMNAAGYPFGGGYEGWAENLGLHEMSGHTKESALHRTQDLIFKSAEHRQWLLQPFFREIGLGVVFGRTRVSGATRDVVVITQKLAASGASPNESNDGSFIQGVVYDDANDNRRYDLGEGVSGVTVTPSTGSTFHGVTSSSGGYALPMANHHGAVSLTFAGETFSESINVTMTGGRSAKADFRLQDLPAAVIIEPPVAVDPSPLVATPVLEIGHHADDGLSIAFPESANNAFILQYSDDLRTWSTIDSDVDDEIALPTDSRQGYYRLAPQP